MKRKLMTFVFSIILIFSGFLPVKAEGYVARIDDTGYPTLEVAIASVPDDVETTIVVEKDTSFNSHLTIGENKKIILDLNGHIVNMNNAGENTIDNNGTLTLTDSSTAGTVHAFDENLNVVDASDASAVHKISTGALYNFSSEITNCGTLKIEKIELYYGAVAVKNKGKGTLILESGTIYGFNEHGIENYGDFTMNGGLISGCDIGDSGDGAGIYNVEGSFTMNAGEISGNKAYRGGAIYSADGGVTLNSDDCILSNNEASEGAAIYAGNTTFTMNGGTISSNKASTDFSAFYFDMGTAELLGGSITGNEVTGFFGFSAVKADNSASLILGGKIVIKDNSTLGGTGNLTIVSPLSISSTKPLENGAEIHLTGTINGTVAEGVGPNDAAYFVNDDSSYDSSVIMARKNGNTYSLIKGIPYSISYNDYDLGELKVDENLYFDNETTVLWENPGISHGKSGFGGWLPWNYMDCHAPLSESNEYTVSSYDADENQVIRFYAIWLPAIGSINGIDTDSVSYMKSKCEDTVITITELDVLDLCNGDLSTLLIYEDINDNGTKDEGEELILNSDYTVPEQESLENFEPIVITLSKNYLDTLKKGKHQFYIEMTALNSYLFSLPFKVEIKVPESNKEVTDTGYKVVNTSTK